MQPSRKAFAIALACLAVAVTADAAAAKTRACRQIEAELAAQGGSSPRLRQYERAIAKQREQMAIARGQARDASCGYALFGRSARQCATITASLDRMAANLDKLERERDRLARTGAKRSRKTLLAAFEANGCREEPAAADQLLAEVPTPLAEMLARAGPEEPGGEAAGMPRDNGQTYRTMCVRTCDGYFYPMSNAATVSDFDRDQQNCESSCPGTDMQIYYDPARGGEPGPMISIRSGMSYASLPTAFQHQDITIPRDPQCGCGIAKNFEVIAGTPAAARLGEPVPTPRLDPASEPDEPDVTVAPAHGGSIVSVDPPERPLAAGPQPTAAPGLRDAPIAPAVSADLDPDRPVRVVGPQFLPDPEAVIDLQDPDRTTAP